MSAQIIYAALAAHQIKQYQDEIEQIRRWPSSRRRDHHLATREALIEEMEQVMELAAEVVEIATPSQQMEEIAAQLREELPSVRWTVATGGIIGCIAALQIVLSRAGRGWKGDLRTTVWSAFEGEVVVVLSAAEASSALTVAQLLVTAAAVRCEQVAA